MACWSGHFSGACLCPATDFVLVCPTVDLSVRLCTCVRDRGAVCLTVCPCARPAAGCS
jgi:hypothetical protein